MLIHLVRANDDSKILDALDTKHKTRALRCLEGTRKDLIDLILEWGRDFSLTAMAVEALEKLVCFRPVSSSCFMLQVFDWASFSTFSFSISISESESGKLSRLVLSATGPSVGSSEVAAPVTRAPNAR